MEETDLTFHFDFFLKVYETWFEETGELSKDIRQMLLTPMSNSRHINTLYHGASLEFSKAKFKNFHLFSGCVF